MDVTITVFIGPSGNQGKRSQIIDQMAKKRKMYAIAYTGAMCFVIAFYAMVIRWTPSAT
jgi:hypothetical protein